MERLGGWVLVGRIGSDEFWQVLMGREAEERTRTQKNSQKPTRTQKNTQEPIRTQKNPRLPTKKPQTLAVVYHLLLIRITGIYSYCVHLLFYASLLPKLLLDVSDIPHCKCFSLVE